MLKTCTRWIYHGESGGIGGTNCTANDDGYESDDDSDDFVLYQQSMFDILGALVDDMGRTFRNKEDASGGLEFF